MSDTDGSLMRRAAAAACLTLVLALPAAAQQVTVDAPAPAGPEFMSRYDFHLSAAALANSDVRFGWDAHFGGDLDLVDYVKGRIAIVVDYDAVLGHEQRLFDANQGNYTLEASSSWRVAGLEVAFFFHHVSRHLSDRPKDVPVAWNVAGARVLRHAALGPVTVDMSGDIGRVTEHATVDYTWVGNGEVVVRRPLTARAGLFARGSGQLIGVDSARGAQSGGLIEGGVRLTGRAGAIELFAGVEKRIDASPLERGPRHWGLVGFRLVR